MFDRLKGMALILYNNTDFAQAAVRETKGWKIGGNKIKVIKKTVEVISEKYLVCVCLSVFILYLCLNHLLIHLLKVDFASQESQMAFYRSMQASGQDIRDFYEIPPERRYCPYC